MDKKMLNTTYDYRLADGTTVKLTTNFYALYQLKAKNETLYKRYNKILQNTSKGFDVLEMATIVYVGYMCANLNVEKPYTEEEFLQLLGSDIKALGNAVKALINPKN